MVSQILYKESDITGRIIGLAMKVHREIGPGFQEKIYNKALIVALENDGLNVESEKEFNVTFQNVRVGNFRMDLVIENKIVVEFKAVAGEMPKLFYT